MIEIKKVEDVIVSTQFLCDLLNVSDVTLGTYKKNGCPQVSYGRWNLKEAMHWYHNYKNMSNDNSNNDINKIETKELISLLIKKL